MPIAFEDFTGYIKPAGFHKHGMHIIPTAHNITIKYYCNTLIARSACTFNCRACIENVRQRLNTTDWNNRPGLSPYALYTFIIKDTAARVMEQTQADQKSAPKLNDLGERDEADALDTLMEAF